VPGKAIVVTACDHRHYDLAVDLVASLNAVPQRDFAIGFIRMGEIPVPDAIAAGADHVVTVSKSRDDVDAQNGFDAAYLGVKARLPELIPGYDRYMWMDGDCWLQNVEGVRQAFQAADHASFAAAPQLDANYWTIPIPGDHIVRTYTAIYGEAEMRRWAYYPSINAGVFAARAGSPLWKAWGEALIDARDRQAGSAEPFYSDQTPLHRLVMSEQLSFHPLRSLNNWLVYRSPPLIDEARKTLRAPSVPFEEINIIHLAGTAKDATFQTRDGRPVSFRYRSIRAFFGLETSPVGEILAR
jgi:hypothetical protein